MIALHCTKKLMDKLPLTDNGHLQPTQIDHHAANDDLRESILSGWHAKLILLQRRQCALFVHDATRFPVFIPALTKPGFASLDNYFCDAFMNTLLKTGADDRLMDLADAALGPLVCDTDCSPSVQGTLNRMGQEVGWHLEYDGIHVAEITGYRLGALLADRPCRVKGLKDAIWPKQAMHQLLIESGQ